MSFKVEFFKLIIFFNLIKNKLIAKITTHPQQNVEMKLQAFLKDWKTTQNLTKTNTSGEMFD